MPAFKLIDADDARDIVARVMARHPDLAANGWDHSGLNRETFARERAKMNNPDFALQVAASYDFIAETYLEAYDSHTLTRAAERWAVNNGYPGDIAIGAFITAALALRYTCERQKNGSNCTFKTFGKRDFTARRRSR